MTHELLKGRPSADLNLIGGRLCLDFVNTIGARGAGAGGESSIRDEKLSDYLDLNAWAQHAGALTASGAGTLAASAARAKSDAARIFREAICLREALYRILRAAIAQRKPKEGDLEILNRWVAKVYAARTLAATSRGFAWTWSEAGLERPLWLVVVSAVDLLIEGDLSRVRVCGGDDCGWLFEDATRNRSRHWCDVGDCGNRDRVRRFRARRRVRA